MGWWDTDVFGGDTPLDFLGDIAEAIGFKIDGDYSLVGVEEWTPEVKYEVCKKLEKKWDKVISSRKFDYEEDIFWQVLGQVCLAVGCIFPQPIRYQMIKSCLKDEWALEGEVTRQKEMARLVHDLTFYKDGEPLPRTTEGFDSYHKAIQTFIQDCS